MAEAQGTTPKQVPALTVVRLAGRISSTRMKSGKDGKFFIHVLRLPAPDAYTSPSSVEILSGTRLGEVGSEVSIHCDVAGYGKIVTPRDPQAEQYASADNVLRFREFA